MYEPSDQELLAHFVRDGSDAALAAIVHRYLPLVFAAARRQVADPGAAEDVAQAVFIILARKVPRLRPPLAGWLLSTTRFCALDAMKRDRRREHHERKAAAMRVESRPEQSTAPEDEGLAAQLDAAMARLGTTDRNAIALHYLREQPVSEVASAIGSSELATRRRLERAIHKLRSFLTGATGTVVPVEVIQRLLTAPSAHNVPPGLVQAVVSGTLHATTNMTAASTAALISKGAMKMMTVAKLKVAAALGVAILMVGGAASYGIRRVAAAPGDASAAVQTRVVVASTAGVRPPATTSVTPEEIGIEIVAVGPFDGDNHKWWSPTGGESNFSRPPIGLSMSVNGKVLYEIAYRCKPDTRAVTPVGAMGSITGKDGITYSMLAAAPEQKTGLLRFQYAAGPWRVLEQISVQTEGLRGKAMGPHFSRDALPDRIHLGTSTGGEAKGPNYAMAYSGLFQTGNDLNTVIIDNLGSNMQRRFAAVDNAENTMVVPSSSSVPAGDSLMSVVTFKNYPIKNMRTLRYEILPDDTWVEFSGISLDGKPSAVKATTGKIDLPAFLKGLPTVPQETAPKKDLP